MERESRTRPHWLEEWIKNSGESEVAFCCGSCGKEIEEHRCIITSDSPGHITVTCYECDNGK